MHSPTGHPLPTRCTVRTPRLIHVPFQATVEAVMLSHAWHGEHVHYDPAAGRQGRDVPCRAPLPCPLCLPGDSRQLPQYKGYAPVLALSGPIEWRGLAVLSLPFLLCRTLETFLSQPEGFRGILFRLRRGESKRNDPVEVLYWGDYGREVPEAFDVRPTLEMVWGEIDWYKRRDVELRAARPRLAGRLPAPAEREVV